MLAVLRQYQSVADRQTDGQTELMYAYQCDARRIRTRDNNVTGLITPQPVTFTLYSTSCDKNVKDD